MPRLNKGSRRSSEILSWMLVEPAYEALGINTIRYSRWIGNFCSHFTHTAMTLERQMSRKLARCFSSTHSSLYSYQTHTRCALSAVQLNHITRFSSKMKQWQAIIDNGVWKWCKRSWASLCLNAFLLWIWLLLVSVHIPRAAYMTQRALRRRWAGSEFQQRSYEY